MNHVVFVISNGRHPDPTKQDCEVDGPTRLALAQAAVAGLCDPAQSLLARQAELAGERLLLTPDRIFLDTREFGFRAPVRTAHLISLLREQQPDSDAPLHWFVGTDLLRRMADPAIFSENDVQALVRQCRYEILEREGDPAEPVIKLVQDQRRLALAHQVYPLGAVPAWLSPFLLISSTLMRHAAEAGDPLGGMLPREAARMMELQGLYRQGRPVAQLQGQSGMMLGARTALQLTLERLQGQLDGDALALAETLKARHAAGLPHGLAVGEGSVGGVLTASLAGRSGASVFFRQARFFYDRKSKENLIGPYSKEQAAVGAELVTLLAKALQEQAGADYAIVESGMAGPPDGSRRSLKNGQCWLALARPEGTATELVSLNPFLTRKEHMIHFSRRAVALVRSRLESP